MNKEAEQSSVWPGLRIFGRLLDTLFVLAGPAYFIISISILIYMVRASLILPYAALLLIGTQTVLSLGLGMFGLCGVFIKRAAGLVIERTAAIRRKDFVMRDNLAIALGDNLGLILITALAGGLFCLIGLITFGIEPVHSLQKSLL